MKRWHSSMFGELECHKSKRVKATPCVERQMIRPQTTDVVNTARKGNDSAAQCLASKMCRTSNA
eukprot:scaffold516857_cov18-Prasinocladus_malaysianus.AAC.1